MKIRSDRKTLANSLAWVAQAIPRKASVPALNGIAVRAEAGALTVQGFDYEVSHQATIDVDVIAEGECLVPGSFLTTFVGQMRGDTIELVLDGDTLSITAGRSAYRTRVLRMDDYPTLPAQAPLVGTVEAHELGSAIAACRRATAAENDVVPILSGIRMVGDTSGLRMTTTNRFVAVDCHLDWAHETDFQALPVGRMIDDACKGLVGEVRIGATDGLLSLSGAGRAVTMRQLDGAFPDMDKVFAAVGDPSLSVLVEGGDLIEAAVRTAKLSDDVTPIDLDVSETSIDLSVAATERGDGAEQIDCRATGTGRATFGPRYLADGLAVMPPGLVRIGVNTDGKPSVIRPADDDGSRMALVMPKRAGGAR